MSGSNPLNRVRCGSLRESPAHDHVPACLSGKRRNMRSDRVHSSEPHPTVTPRWTDFRPQPLWPYNSLIDCSQSIRRPRVRRAGILKKNGSKRTVYSKNSLVKNTRGSGAGAENRLSRSPRGMAVRSSGLVRIALFGVSRSSGRKRGHGWPIQDPTVVH